MQKDILILNLLCAAIGVLFVGLWIAFLMSKTKTNIKSEKFPSAEELLAKMSKKENSLQDLIECVKFAKIHYNLYMGEVEDFDMKFLLILATHKATDAKLILDVESYFKLANPQRKEKLEKILGVGMARR